MKNAVSPLKVEAQALNYLSFDFLTLLNNFWTWLALSLWRIPTPTSEFLPPPHHPVPIPTVLGYADADVDGVRKGKFTLYYDEDEIERECETVTVTVTEEWEEREGRREWWETWESLLRMRRGENENGWYTSQDLTALNGSVVRLWEPASTCVLMC